MIENKQYIIRKSDTMAAAALPQHVDRLTDGKTLRWYVSQVNDETIAVEATTYDGDLQNFSQSVVDSHYPGKSVVLSIIPTGVGCNIGGYAGDAAPATRLLATAIDYLITNPNAVNASDFIVLDRNVVYTEGASIDLFCQGLVNLHIPYSNRVGLIIEKTGTQELDVLFNILNTVRAVYGVNITDYVITDELIGSRCRENSAGAFVGTIDHPHALFAACDQLIARGVDAIAMIASLSRLFATRHHKP